jgi:hypothetical protein
MPAINSIPARKLSGTFVITGISYIINLTGKNQLILIIHVKHVGIEM